MPKRVARTEFNLLLQIGELNYRVSSASANFALNKIPSARADLAIGREARTLERALIHDTAGGLKKLVPARIIFLPKGEWSPQDVGFAPGFGRWDDVGPQVVFDGYVAGAGYRRQRGTVRFSVNLIHWLSDLNFSSALSNQSHPGNPTRLRWRAVYGDATAFAPTNFIAQTRRGDFFGQLKIQQDFWGKSLHPFFCSIASEDILSEFDTSPCDGFKGGSANTSAQLALSRFETGQADKDVVGKSCEDGAKSPYWKPLPLDMGLIPGLIAQSIGDWCNQMTLESYFQTTLWDKIVGLIGPAFNFAIVPRVQTAIAAPFVPGLQTTFDREYNNGKRLDLADVTYIDIHALLPRPLRAVGILSVGGSTTTGVPDPNPIATVGGCYGHDDVRGMVIFRKPPGWLSTAPGHGHSASATAIPGMPGSATVPVEPGIAVPPETPVSAENKMGNYYDRVAQYVYAQEMLRGRFAVVQGKLRFDLAPGTTIAISNRQPLHIPNDQLSGDLVASVIRVGYSMNAEASQAGTALQLEHLRTPAENENDDTSVAQHPLYSNFFTGAPLLHDYLFEE